MTNTNRINLLYKLGFDKVSFPILIRDESDLEFVYKLEHFARDSDLYFWKFESNVELIDSTGNVYFWIYDSALKTNLPGDIKKKLSLNDIKIIVNTHFKKSRIENKVKELTENVNSVYDLYAEIADLF